MELSGKVALVTGAAKRVGRAIALALAEGGADVVVHVHTSPGDEVARAITACGRRVRVLRADLSRVEAARQLSRDALAFAGHLDILVNNAAVFWPSPLPGLRLADWKTMLQTNLTAPFVLSLLCGRAMQARGAGKIVQLGDWSGQRPQPDYVPYCVSKGGVHALTQVLAKALAPHVQVNEVALGPVLPPADYDAAARQDLRLHTPLGRLGDVADVVRAVRFVIAGGDFVTGATYAVDGGWLASRAGGTGRAR